MRSLRRLMLCVSLAAAAHPGAAAPELNAKTASPGQIEARARRIISRMTLDEKCQELHGVKDKTNFRYTPPVPRLGIPAFAFTNGPAGACNGGPGHTGPATALPAPISLAATWDVNASKLYGQIAGGEARDQGNHMLEAPDINIARVPQNGRTFEGYGEDPYLDGQISVANIQGIQSQGEIANVKHYAVNNQEEQRKTINEVVDERTLREIYLPAFEVSIKKGHAGSVMGAYPSVNGAFCCENPILLNQILKREWGFDGFVTSDFTAVHNTVASAMGGLDYESQYGEYYGDLLKDAVQSGQVPMSVVDNMLMRRFRIMMRLGLFDAPLTRKPIPAQAHGAVARKLAEEGMVLLKNGHSLLPLNAARLNSIALIGPYAVKASTGGGGSSLVKPLYTVSPMAGLQRRVGPRVKVSLADGSDIAKAVALAKSSSVAVVMVGDYEREGHDHPITLENNQDSLVEAVAQANPHTIVVLKSGSAELMPWVNTVPAILEAWYPGEEDGSAVAAVLFGDVNPSGKLPITFPRRSEDLPANTPEQYPGVGGQVHYSEGVLVGYRHYDAEKIAPLFPFGHGLSYTTFSYGHLVAPKSYAPQPGRTVSVDFNIANTGKRAGTEIAQVYVAMPSTDGVPQPPKQLKGFARVSVLPGKTGHAQVTLDPRSFAYWDVADHGWKVAGGTYQILVGASSRDIRLQAPITVQAGSAQ